MLIWVKAAVCCVFLHCVVHLWKIVTAKFQLSDFSLPNCVVMSLQWWRCACFPDENINVLFNCLFCLGGDCIRQQELSAINKTPAFQSDYLTDGFSYFHLEACCDLWNIFLFSQFHVALLRRDIPPVWSFRWNVLRSGSSHKYSILNLFQTKSKLQNFKLTQSLQLINIVFIINVYSKCLDHCSLSRKSVLGGMVNTLFDHAT